MYDTHSPTRSHALVIGAGITGLLAAQVLSKYFEGVTIVERDSLPEQPDQRKGVPQSNHGHLLLSRGQQILEQLFPGIVTELTAEGALLVDATADFLRFSAGAWSPRFASDIITVNCSRNLLEWAIRRRVVSNNRVIFMQGAQVRGLLFNNNQSKVTGVRVSFHNQGEVNLIADLVVDASGRNSHSPQWLKAMGYTPPQKTVFTSFVGYTSRWYQPPENFQADYKNLVILGKSPEVTRSGALLKVNQNSWVVMLAGFCKDYPPTDEAGFLEFARSLSAPTIYEAIKNAQAVSPIYIHKRTENCWYHYEKMPRLPESFVLVGDTVCAVNPLYGQGMTMAALSVLTLDQCLNKHLLNSSDGNLIGLSRRFQKQLAKVISLPWIIATSEDSRWTTIKNKQPKLITRLLHLYMDRVLLLSANNDLIHKTVTEVAHMLKSPTALFHPYIITRVLQQVKGVQQLSKIEISS